MKVRFPPVFAINEIENSNSIQQIITPPWEGEATVAPYEKGKVKGLQVTPDKAAHEPVLIQSNSVVLDGETPFAIRTGKIEFDARQTKILDLSEGRWTKHSRLPPSASDNDIAATVSAVIESWNGAFSYRTEDANKGQLGLRPPQLGAIHAVQAHWTVDSEVATVVLPTGVGKTETMISLLVAERCPRLLVVVPTDPLRTQLAEKFLTLGLLKTSEFGVISKTALNPVVGTLSRRPKNEKEVEEFFRKCNVVVTTMPLASQCSPEVIAKMAELSTWLFIDEAHHVAAPTWNAFKQAFTKSKVVQFTATPFRSDDQPLGGKRVFTFSLKNAQEQGYFKKISFKGITEFDPNRKDTAIAEAAVEQLRNELSLGHILMARVSSISRAAEVFKCYEKYSEFRPVQIHTGIKSKSERNKIREQLLSGETRIVVCVDMLGEGFDLPELKIAAFHDIRKSLPVTLQLIGRFTRSKPSLGNATIIANIADLEVKNELKRLYQHEPDWNALLPVLSDKASKGELSLWEFINGFQDLPSGLTLRNVKPSMSTVVYKTKCKAWRPDRFKDGLSDVSSLDRIYDSYNPSEETLVIVTTKKVSVEWAQIDEIHNWDWQLYVLHWDKKQNLLFIHNSSNAGFFKRLAEAVAGEDVEQIKGANIFRCLAAVNRFKYQNIGLLEQLGRLIRYTMRAGSDVEPGMSAAQKQKAIKANLFGQGYENGHRSTIGCSYKGRIWSYRKTNLLELTRWSRGIGEKLLDESLDPEEVLKGTLTPVWISERPEKIPIAVDWPEIFYKEPEQAFSFDIAGTTVYRHEVDLVLKTADAKGPLKFSITSGEHEAEFLMPLLKLHGNPDYTIEATGRQETTLVYRAKRISLKDFFDENPPTFWFADGSSLTGCEYVELKRQPVPFPKERILRWDWKGTNIQVESQGPQRQTDSVQYRVATELKKKAFTVIFDDDDKGESADVVAIAENDDSLEVEFWHCKYASEPKSGNRIEELYALCGQAQKSVRWLEKPRDLFTHLLRRDPRKLKGSSTTRFEKGAKDDLLRIREKADAQPLKLRIYIVQPGLKVESVSRDQLELIAVTENYLLETFAVPLSIVGNAA